MTSKILGSTLALSLAFGAAANSAWAGSMADPIVTPEVIALQTSSSINHHILPPAFFVAAVVAGMVLAPVLAPSDIRLKTDITRTGTADNGLPLYHFRYIGQAQLWEGVMAQDVLAHTPDAVVDLGGYYGVNYEMLGLEMQPVN